MTRKRLLPPTLRLALGLAVSSFVFLATASGPWAWAPSALLWAAPFLVALRCLPAIIAVPLVVGVGTAARLVAGAETAGAALAASALLVPLGLVDRVVERHMPRASLVVWPLGLTALWLLTRGHAFGALVAPAPEHGVIADVRAALGAWTVPMLSGLVSQAFGALGTVHNRPADRFDVRVREAGVRWAAVVGLFLPTVVISVVATGFVATGVVTGGLAGTAINEPASAPSPGADAAPAIAAP